MGHVQPELISSMPSLCVLSYSHVGNDGMDKLGHCVSCISAMAMTWTMQLG